MICRTNGQTMDYEFFIKHRRGPKKLFRQCRIPRCIRMSQSVPTGRHAVPNLSEITFMKTQAVTNVVQAQRMRQLGKEHCHNVTRFRKGACLDSVLDLQFFDKFCGNVLDNLTKHCHIMFLRTHVCLRLVAENKVACVLFLSSFQIIWDICERKEQRNKQSAPGTISGFGG